ncbi:MAG: hypothetical protein DLM56_08495 [Pseudonocardiales bacterium]|nr:MAG: hypothetical protein DLM56_08495 [Pseudonocardiales bacterium]
MILSLPPWRRAIALGLRQRTVAVAVAGAAAILACAAASGELFLSSASSESLHRLVAARCPDAPYPALRVIGTQPGSGSSIPDVVPLETATLRAVTTLETAVPRQFARSGLPAPQRFWLTAGIQVRTPRAPGFLTSWYYRDGQFAHVRAIDHIAGHGIWITDTAAKTTGLTLGSRLPDSGERVVGIFRDPATYPVAPYWCSQKRQFEATSLVQSEPVPSPVLVTDPATYLHTIGFLNDYTDIEWWAPIDTRGLTLQRAHRILTAESTATRALAHAAPSTARMTFVVQQQAGGAQNALADMTARAELLRRGLHGPVVPIAIGGALIALLLVGAAGSLWVDRRRGEVRLLGARGVSPSALGAKAMLEMSVPLVAGTAAGWALAIGLVRVLGPGGAFDATAPTTAAITAGIGVVAGIALLGVVAAVRSRAAIERVVGARSSWAAVVPWEIVVLIAAGLMFWRLHGEKSVRQVNGVALVNELLVAFPLVFALGAVTLVVRLVGGGLLLVNRRAARWPVAGYLAARRIAGARVVSVTLLAAAGLPIAVLVYAGATTATTRKTVEAKATVYSGAPVSVASTDAMHPTPALDAAGTLLRRYSGPEVQVGGHQAEVLAIDPETFGRYAFWDHRFADRSLPALMSALRAPGRTPPVLLIPTPGNAAAGPARGATAALALGITTLPVRVADRPITFPGIHDAYDALVVIDARRLPAVDPNVEYVSEVWSTKPHAEVLAAMATQGAREFYQITPVGVIDATSYLSVSWTFGYLEALAALVGVVAVGGLLLYLATRARSRSVSYTLGRRMGLSRASHLRSLVGELAALLLAAYAVGTGIGLLAVLSVYSSLDVDPARRPPALLTTPGTMFVGSLIAVLVTIAGAVWLAQHVADRARPADVMRLET